MRGKWLRIGVLAYVAGLHALVLVLIFKTDFLTLAGKTLGLIPPAERTLAMYEDLQDLARRGQDVPDGMVIVLGDSIMAALDGAEIGPDVRVFASGGLTSATLGAFLPSLPPLRGARAVILGIGTNDLRFRPEALIARDQAALLAQFRPGMAVILMATLPVRESNGEIRRRPHLRNAAIARMNEGLRALCAVRPGCHFVPTLSVMADARGELDEAVHAGDGWHLSPAGSSRLAGLLRAALDAVRPVTDGAGGTPAAR